MQLLKRQYRRCGNLSLLVDGNAALPDSIDLVRVIFGRVNTVSTLPLRGLIRNIEDHYCEHEFAVVV